MKACYLQGPLFSLLQNVLVARGMFLIFASSPSLRKHVYFQKTKADDVLICLDCCNKNSHMLIASNDKLISQSSESWGVQDQGLASWFIHSRILAHTTKRVKRLSETLFIRTLIPFMRTPSLRLNDLPKFLPPNTTILGVRISLWLWQRE